MISLSLIQDETYNLRHSHGEEKVECDTARLAHVARDTVCFDRPPMPSGNGKGKLSNPREATDADRRSGASFRTQGLDRG